jgi:hypothetical protein
LNSSFSIKPGCRATSRSSFPLSPWFPALTEVVEWHYHEEDDPCLVWFRQMIVKRTASLFDAAA